jgi:hypothetical protein
MSRFEYLGEREQFYHSAPITLDTAGPTLFFLAVFAAFVLAIYFLGW